jgi:hypothetical protein
MTPTNKEANMTEAAAYKEYTDIVRPPEQPRGSINEIQLLSKQPEPGGCGPSGRWLLSWPMAISIL